MLTSWQTDFIQGRKQESSALVFSLFLLSLYNFSLSLSISLTIQQQETIHVYMVLVAFLMQISAINYSKYAMGVHMELYGFSWKTNGEHLMQINGEKKKQLWRVDSLV